MPTLSSATFWTLGKDQICRVPHSAKTVFAECLALGKEVAECPTLGKSWHSAKIVRDLAPSTLPSARRLALGRFFLFFATKSFLKLYYTMPDVWHLANFFCFLPPNLFWSFTTLSQTTCSNLGYFIAFWYISLVYFVSLTFFGNVSLNYKWIE
jgi:hypothetical protein